jgi:hypothetical protein
MHLRLPRTWFVSDGMMQIPASTTPWVRFHMFWLSLHWLPEWLYHYLTRRVLRHDGYFTTYFHPWEFYELGEHPEMNMGSVDFPGAWCLNSAAAPSCTGIID